MPPHADPQILQFVAQYCRQHLAIYGFSRLFLIGSRAYGIPRAASDHDFIAVVSDSAPEAISTGGTLHSQIFIQFNSARSMKGYGGIDLMIARDSYFNSQSMSNGTFANSAITKGYRVV